MNIALIVAAGRGDRFGGESKQFALAGGAPVLMYSVAAFYRSATVDRLVVAVRETEVERCRREVVLPLAAKKPILVTVGGDSRQASVAAALSACPKETNLVFVHDGARPLVTTSQIDSMVDALGDNDGVILGAPAVDTVKIVKNGEVVDTPKRSSVWLAQTPQLFKYHILKVAHDSSGNLAATDDATLVEKLGGRVGIMAATGENIKVTTATDLAIVEYLLKGRSSKFKVFDDGRG